MDQAYKKMGELLVAEQLISYDQLTAALELQASTGQRLGKILVLHGFVSEDQIASCLARQYGYRLVDPTEVFPTPDALALLSLETAMTQRLLPFAISEDTIFCLVADPIDVSITDHLATKYKKKVSFAVAPEAKLSTRIRKAYGGSLPAAAVPGPALPERYSRAVVRRESDGVQWIDAHDTYLDRRVSLVSMPFESPHSDRHLNNMRQCAKANDPSVAVIYDTFAHEQNRLTALQYMSGHQLSDSLAFKKAKSPMTSAAIVASVAKAASALSLDDPSWICPENVWIEDEAVRVTTVFSAAPGYDHEDEIEALGGLLWQCLMGRLDFTFDLSSGAEAIPSSMLLILQRCLTSSENRFSRPEELFKALSTFKWTATLPTATPAAAPLDREELLATLRVVTNPRKPTLWQRIFVRRAA